MSIGNCGGIKHRLILINHIQYFNYSSTIEEIPIYNYVSSVENPLTWGQFTKLNIKNGFKYPFSSAFWYLCFSTHKSAFVNWIYVFFLHVIPAFLFDTISLCLRKKPRLLKIYEKIHKFSSVISFFCTNKWVSKQLYLITFYLRC